jgi:hypothetical protein
MAQAKDWYVSVSRGRGKKGTLKKPAKDLGNILKKLKPGDRVFIAEGTYLGRGKNGHDQVLVPVEIYGGFSDDFSKRDPWGAHKTILTGDNSSKNWKGGYRLSVKLAKWRDSKTWTGKSRYDAPAHRIVVDGVIVDNAPRNRYKTDKRHKIVRTANPKKNQMPTPESGGISVSPWWGGDAVVRNCVILNTAPTQGVLALWGNKNSRMLAENNLILNNTGNGIQVLTSWHPRDGVSIPRFVIRNNTSLFNHKHDPIASYGGSGMAVESDCLVQATGNVLGFNDYYGLDNMKRAKAMIFNGNLLFANIQADYIEFDTRIGLEAMEDEAELLDEAEDNSGEALVVPVSAEYKGLYLARNVIDRNAAEADVKALNTGANALRSMLGLNLQGSAMKVDSEVWLPAMAVDDGLRAAGAFGGKGAKKPPVSGADVKVPDLKATFEDLVAEE